MNHLEALSQYIKATNTHDFENVRKVLHPEAIYWFTGKRCTNMDEIQYYFENAWRMIKDEVYSINNVQWLTIDNNSASCLYNYEYKGYLEGEFVQGRGRATNVFIKDNEGNWKLIHEHLSN
ncbi:SnoaL-like protein [Paenibacillus taihuensis]|uniref:SnoaL-like protein n=1 Tax=Paenibacillus taihuensis TaxID=1156355 RepID=A0A3D9RQT2_9BACL|nr:nuclear transport factor 2 family protein [Paenibacillus taihuensis]REE77710.1 SnoaL-like protein [Paenibacillus taihuensis]